MKIYSLTFILLLAASVQGFAQKTFKAKKKMTLKIVATDGTRGCSMVYSPDKSVYYASIAGNADYPLETFSKKGKNLHTRDAGVDLRGVWYNPDTKKLEANGYSDAGIVSYVINDDASPGKNSVIFAGADHQPTDQSAGAYNPDSKQIYYFSEGEIHVYNRSNGDFYKSFELKNSPVDVYSYNATNIIYTGKKGFELGLLNFSSNEVCLFDLNGNYTGKVSLPSDAITADMFRFSYANGHIWLYDIDTRSWTGYKF